MASYKSCPDCDFRTTIPQSLRQHINSKHTQEKLFHCPAETCLYVATSPDSLRYHNKSKHMKIKHTCPHCNEHQATTKQGLEFHIQSKHSRSKRSRLKCGIDDCDYVAKTIPGLKYHVSSTHENNKYFCELCNHQATTKQGLKYHTKAKHNQDLLKCRKCDFATGDTSNFTAHYKSEHNANIFHAVSGTDAALKQNNITPESCNDLTLECDVKKEPKQVSSDLKSNQFDTEYRNNYCSLKNTTEELDSSVLKHNLNQTDDSSANAILEQNGVKRKPGRPRIRPKVELNTVKRKRGRPRLELEPKLKSTQRNETKIHKLEDDDLKQVMYVEELNPEIENWFKTNYDEHNLGLSDDSNVSAILEQNGVKRKRGRSPKVKNNSGGTFEANGDHNLEYIDLIESDDSNATLILDHDSIPKRGRPKLTPESKKKQEKESCLCGFCGASMKNKNELLDHILNNHNTKSSNLTCKICNHVAKNKQCFNYHKAKHFKRNFRCSHCGHLSLTKQALVTHVTSWHSNLKCSLCEFTTSSEYLYKKHLLKHEQSENGVTNDEFLNDATENAVNKRELDKNKEKDKSTKHNINNFSCNTKHINKKFSCKHCTHLSNSKQELMRHIKLKHLHGHKLKCGKCLYTTGSKVLYKRHLLKHAQKEDDITNDNLSDKGSESAVDKRKNEKEIQNTKRNNNILNSQNTKDSNRDRTCKLCHFIATKNHSLGFHIRTRHSQRKFRCSHCGYLSLNKQALMIHVTSKHSNLKCRLCEFTTTSEYIYTKHVLKHEQNKDGVTNDEFLNVESENATNKRELINNKDDIKSIKRNRNKFSCKICSHIANNYQAHRYHVRTKHLYKKFNCKYCAYLSPTKQRLMVHIKSQHIHTQKLKCGKCPYITKSKLFYKKHLLRHYEEDNQFLNKETEITADKHELNKNEREENNKRENNDFNCNICSYVAKSYQALKYHLHVKHLNERINCEYCTHSSTTKQGLMRHIQAKHIHKQQYKCEQCPFSTKSKLVFKRHLRTKHNLTKLEETHEIAHETIQNIDDSSKTSLNTFNCAHCDYTTDNFDIFEEHLDTHNVEISQQFIKEEPLEIEDIWFQY